MRGPCEGEQVRVRHHAPQRVHGAISAMHKLIVLIFLRPNQRLSLIEYLGARSERLIESLTGTTSVRRTCIHYTHSRRSGYNVCTELLDTLDRLLLPEYVQFYFEGRRGLATLVPTSGRVYPDGRREGRGNSMFTSLSNMFCGKSDPPSVSTDEV